MRAVFRATTNHKAQSKRQRQRQRQRLSLQEDEICTYLYVVLFTAAVEETHFPHTWSRHPVTLPQPYARTPLAIRVLATAKSNTAAITFISCVVGHCPKQPSLGQLGLSTTILLAKVLASCPRRSRLPNCGGLTIDRQGRVARHQEVALPGFLSTNLVRCKNHQRVIFTLSK